MRRLLIALALLTLGATTPPSFTVLNTTITDADTFAMVEIDKSAKASSYSTISVKTVDGTAKAGVDYQPVSRSQTVANNTTATRIPVPIIARPGYQGPRTFTLHLSVTRYGTVRVADATITINDSEPAPPSVTWSKCADENGTCYVIGTANVRYGSGSTWLTKSVTGSIGCNNATWTDPTPGVFKECDTDGQVGTAPAPTPTPAPTPLPNNPCYDQNGALISSACLARACPDNANPVPYEQPCGITWKPTGLPPQIGGYVFVKGSRPDGLCCNGLIMKVVNRWYDASGKALDMYGAVYEDDPSGNFPAANPYWQTHEGGLGTVNVIAVAP